MLAMIDDLDRQIVAALIRNGRAPFRLIAEVLGQQERTVARRANKLLASGNVRVQSFSSPTALATVDLYMLRVHAVPAKLDAIATWLAGRADTHWISSLAGASECIVELFLEPKHVGSFLYDELARVEGVRDFSLEPVFDYYRTVSGWRPDILSNEQYERLSPSEAPELITRHAELGISPLDSQKRILLELLRSNGRVTIDEIATDLGVSKTTASRRLDMLIAEGAIHVRAILDPGTIGYPVEGLLAVHTAPGKADGLGRYLADLSTTRWAANVSGVVLVQSAHRSLSELRKAMEAIAALDGVHDIKLSLFAGIHKRSTVAYQNGKLPAQ